MGAGRSETLSWREGNDVCFSAAVPPNAQSGASAPLFPAPVCLSDNHELHVDDTDFCLSRARGLSSPYGLRKSSADQLCAGEVSTSRRGEERRQGLWDIVLPDLWARYPAQGKAWLSELGLGS